MLNLLRQRPIQREPSRPAQQQRPGHGQRQQMKFDALAFLAAHPVHEESVRQMNHEDRPNHQAANSESSDASEQSHNQPQAAKEFRTDNQNRHRGWHSHMSESSHGAVKTKASKPDRKSVVKGKTR